DPGDASALPRTGLLRRPAAHPHGVRRADRATARRGGAHGRPVGADDTIRTLPTGTVERVLPLSAAQRRLWFLDDLTSSGVEYNTGVALRLSGPLDRAALRTALAGLVARHES